MSTFFYNLIIFPIESIIEFVYVLFSLIFHNTFFSIVGVSIAVNILSLPLYNIAEKWQTLERETQKRLKPKVDRIKAVFSGDEQYMILSTYYRQEHYHPIYAMRSSISLLIQVPFFIAAYNFLSNLESLRGLPFLFINNLGSPDNLFQIGSLAINVLPILMTVINVISGAIYTKGFPVKEKVQLYAMAGLFLILLYNSPSGLVIYWTLNNLFSLIKNIFYKLKNPLKIFYIIASALAGFVIIYILGFHDARLIKRIFLSVALLIIPLAPLFVKAIKLLINKVFYPLISDKKTRNALFFSSILVLWLLTGLFIPSALVQSSPLEFSFIGNVNSPLTFVFMNLLRSAGIFLFWFVALYFLFKDKIKVLFAAFGCALAFSSLINVVFFPGDYGSLSGLLIYSEAFKLQPTIQNSILNIGALIFVILAIFFVIKIKQTKRISALNLLISLALCGVSIFYCVKTYSSYSVFISKTKTEINTEKSKTTIADDNLEKFTSVFSLSKTEKNVVIIMLDRAVNSFFPLIMEDSPKTKKEFEGFKYYPNTVSYNGHTNLGAPVLFGGYEYSPEEINKRTNETLVSKHNEALTVMPRLFAEHNFKSKITDASWANYNWIPDNSIFSLYPNIDSCNLEGFYNSLWLKENKNIIKSATLVDEILERNICYFTLLRISPSIIRFYIYNDGKYWTSNVSNSNIDSIIKSYAVLDFLPEITTFYDNNDSDAKKGSFICMVNNLTHEEALLEYPEYTPIENADDTGPKYVNNYYLPQYHTNAAALHRLGEWFDYLKENNVFDNTKIIIVSDHGAGIDSEIFKDMEDKGFDYNCYNPLLLVKDYNSTGEYQTDMTFMSNGDVPYLASKDIIKDPKNPFSGKSLAETPKEQGLNIVTNHLWSPEKHNKNTFVYSDEDVVNVKENIFNDKNWIKKTKQGNK